MNAHNNFRWPQSGFTLVELVVIIVVLGIMSVYATMKSVSPAVFTLPSQAEKLASDIRHMQTLATTWGRSLRLSATAGANGVYSVKCVVSGASPCNTYPNPVIDPATGTSFSVAVQKDVVLAGPITLDFNSLGQPSAAASYCLTSGGSTENVGVAALTGLVAVTAATCP